MEITVQWINEQVIRALFYSRYFFKPVIAFLQVGGDITIIREVQNVISTISTIHFLSFVRTGENQIPHCRRFRRRRSTCRIIGNAADGVLELALGSAVVIRNSVGVLLLLLLVAGCAVPLLQILFTAGFIKCATAFMGIVSDKRITNCTDRMGNAMMLLFRTVGTALLLFMVTLALLAIGSRGI